MLRTLRSRALAALALLTLVEWCQTAGTRVARTDTRELLRLNTRRDMETVVGVLPPARARTRARVPRLGYRTRCLAAATKRHSSRRDPCRAAWTRRAVTGGRRASSSRRRAATSPTRSVPTRVCPRGCGLLGRVLRPRVAAEPTVLLLATITSTNSPNMTIVQVTRGFRRAVVPVAGDRAGDLARTWSGTVVV